MPLRRRWDPLRELLDLQERINHLFDQSLSRGRPESPQAGSPAWIPLADVYETAEGFVIQVELPGIAQKDLNLHVDPHEVVLRGERRQLGTGRPESFHRMERSIGQFQRSFRLSAAVDPEGVNAELRDGVLRIELPKTWVEGAARIRIAKDS